MATKISSLIPKQPLTTTSEDELRTTNQDMEGEIKKKPTEPFLVIAASPPDIFTTAFPNGNANQTTMHIEFPCRTDAGIDEASGDDWARGKRTVHALGDLEEPVGRLAVEELAEERHAAGPRFATRGGALRPGAPSRRHRHRSPRPGTMRVGVAAA